MAPPTESELLAERIATQQALTDLLCTLRDLVLDLREVVQGETKKRNHHEQPPRRDSSAQS